MPSPGDEGWGPARGDERALESARRVLDIEAEAIARVRDGLGAGFARAAALILGCEGKVIVSGVGKSGHVGRKIASTLASTGTPSFFLHPAEGTHGDLGMANARDVFLFISHSGASEEVVRLIPFVRRLGCPVISMVGNPASPLGRNSDLVIPVEVTEEACPLGLAPTASTTAAMAMGDALAVALLEMRGFTRDDFAMLHPGGTLGRRLLLTVGDIMHSGEALPLVRTGTVMREALFEITSKGLGVTGVVGDDGRLVGVITDGDLRRGLQRGNDLLEKPARDVMTSNPKGIPKGALAVDALNRMERHAITSLFVFEEREEGEPVGVIHLHDLLKAGVV
jgi:arabinose-5-phosphate isomerase